MQTEQKSSKISEKIIGMDVLYLGSQVTFNHKLRTKGLIIELAWFLPTMEGMGRLKLHNPVVWRPESPKIPKNLVYSKFRGQMKFLLYTALWLF